MVHSVARKTNWKRFPDYFRRTRTPISLSTSHPNVRRDVRCLKSAVDSLEEGAQKRFNQVDRFTLFGSRYLVGLRFHLALLIPTFGAACGA